LIGTFTNLVVTRPLDANGSVSFLGNTLNYDPTLGNLLMDVIVTNQDNVPNGSGGYLDADDTGTCTGRLWDVNNPISHPRLIRSAS